MTAAVVDRPRVDASPRLSAALGRIEFSRGMTKGLLEDLRPDDWFWQPGEGLNPIAWQVGHLAFAEYFLCLKRLRDRTVEDETLAPTWFLKRYKQGSRPSGDPAENCSPEELVERLDAIHATAMRELPGCSDEQLAEASRPQHPVFDDKIGAVEWCSQHELMHAGQIVMLRRLRGYSPRY